MKVIKFNNKDLVISYLKFNNHIKINRNNQTIIFNNKEYQPNDFIEYLESIEVLTIVYSYNTIYDVENRMHTNITNIEYITLNSDYFNSIINDGYYDKYNRYLIGINETAKLIDVTRQTINNMIASNKLQAYKIGSSVKLKYKDVLNYINQNKAV